MSASSTSSRNFDQADNSRAPVGADADADAALMLRVQHDDAFAFEQLVERYQSRLVGVMAHIGPQHDVAEDLAQEVFLKVFRARKTYQPTAKFSTWLFAIATRVASNARRAAGRKRERTAAHRAGDTSANSLEQLAKDASGMMPSRVVARAERSQIVREAIAALQPRQRTALVLSKFEDMSYEEIGAALELSSAAVKSLLSRARESLRKQLAPYFNPRNSHLSDGGG